MLSCSVKGQCSFKRGLFPNTLLQEVSSSKYYRNNMRSCQELCLPLDLFCSVMMKWCSFHSVLADCLNSDDSETQLLIFI